MYEDYIVAYIKVRSYIQRAIKEGNFGGWCIHDKKLFCQEREGCSNCCIALRDGASIQ